MIVHSMINGFWGAMTFLTVMVVGVSYVPILDERLRPCVTNEQAYDWRKLEDGVWAFKFSFDKNDRCGKPVTGSITWSVLLPDGSVRLVPLDIPGDDQKYDYRPPGHQETGEWIVDFSRFPDAIENFGTVRHKPGMWELPKTLGPFPMPGIPPPS